MKILIDTEKKTIKLEGKVEFKELNEFVEKNNLQDYQIEPEVITLQEKEQQDPIWPSYPTWPSYPVSPYWSILLVQCSFSETNSNTYLSITNDKLAQIFDTHLLVN